MDRRAFTALAAYGLVLAPLDAMAQSSGKMPVVGVLQSGSASSSESWVQFREAMRELGYAEGKNIVFASRSAGSAPERLPRLAAELVSLNVDVLYATGPLAVRAARDATSKIPIVALDLESDPVQSGLVKSLSHPGGNVTGLFLDLPDLAGKWLELLKEAVPGHSRVGLLWDSSTGTRQLDAAKTAGRRLAINLVVLEFRRPQDLAIALKNGLSNGTNALIMLSSPLVSQNSRQIAEFAFQNRLPAISPFQQFAESGGFMSYGPDLRAFRRFAASYVDKILKGAQPSELPIQQPTDFKLVINAKTAKALDVTIPQSLLLRADEVIH